jgi:hypothetical protein
MAPKIGFEPMTNWLTANCSTAELLRKLTLDRFTNYTAFVKLNNYYTSYITNFATQKSLENQSILSEDPEINLGDGGLSFKYNNDSKGQTTSFRAPIPFCEFLFYLR